MIAHARPRGRKDIPVTEYLHPLTRVRTVTRELPCVSWLESERARLEKAGIPAELRYTRGGRIALFRLC